MMPEPGPAKSTGWWQRAALVAVVAGVAAVYFWTARSGSDEPMEFGRRQSDYYNLLVHGWLGGHLYMAVEPDPNLRIEHPNRILTPEATYLLDASYHQGHYYLYFGVTPVLLVMLPYSAITGADLPVSFVAALFATLGFALQVALLALLRRRFFPQSPPWLWLVVAATVGFANVLPATLRHPMFYEAAIAAGYAFVQAALLCLTLALLNPARAKRWLVLASLCAGLAAGARPNLILGPLLVLPAAVAWLWWRGAPSARTARRAGGLLLAGGLPAALCVAALLWHNHARFGDALEFGINLQLGNPRGYACSFAYSWHNAKLYYFTPPELDWYFPFFSPGREGAPPDGYYGSEQLNGQFFVTPLLLAALLYGLWRLRRAQGIDPRLLFLVIGMLGWALVEFAIVAAGGVRSNRYMVDFHPIALSLLVLAVLAWAQGSFRAVRLGAAGAGAWMAAVAGYNLLISFQVHSFFRDIDPRNYTVMEQAANRLVAPFQRLFPSAPGGQRWRVTMQDLPAGKVEPLLATGTTVEYEVLLLDHLGPGRARLLYDHPPYGLVRGRPFSFQPGVPLVFDLQLGSLYPPVGHPWFGDLSRTAQEHLRNSVRVLVDGEEVLDGGVPTYRASPRKWRVGQRWLMAWGEPRFTGRDRTIGTKRD